MKTKIIKTKLLLTTIVSAFIILPSALGQGALTPPGAPAPTMKTLAQIEPRTAITNAASAVTISQPGSYYLTGNLTVSSGNAITIATNGVTLDLNGFTIRSTTASAAGYAIVFSGSSPRDITILNGHIQGGVTNNGGGVYNGSGFDSGIYYSNSAPVNVLVSKVSVSGCLTYGIYLNNGDATVVEACTARTIGGYGIWASTVKGCGAADCGNTAIQGDQVSDCRGASVGSGFGIYAINTAQNCYGTNSGSGYGIAASTAQNCSGYSSGGGNGLYASTAQNCYGYCSGGGIAFGDTTAQNCYAYCNGGNAMLTTIALNCYGSAIGLGYGINANIAQNCYATSTTGIGLTAFIANSCHGIGSPGVSATHNVNSF